MGASYGSLLASKLLFGGHSVKLVCLPAEAELINAEGFRVRMPVKGRKDPIEIDSLYDAVSGLSVDQYTFALKKAAFKTPLDL